MQYYTYDDTVPNCQISKVFAHADSRQSAKFSGYTVCMSGSALNSINFIAFMHMHMHMHMHTHTAFTGGGYMAVFARFNQR